MELIKIIISSICLVVAILFLLFCGYLGGKDDSKEEIKELKRQVEMKDLRIEVLEITLEMKGDTTCFQNVVEKVSQNQDRDK